MERSGGNAKAQPPVEAERNGWQPQLPYPKRIGPATGRTGVLERPAPGGKVTPVDIAPSRQEGNAPMRAHLLRSEEQWLGRF